MIMVNHQAQDRFRTPPPFRSVPRDDSRREGATGQFATSYQRIHPCGSLNNNSNTTTNNHKHALPPLRGTVK